MKIKRKADLVEYIKRQLGAPLIKIELHDSQIEDAIDKAIKKYSEYGYDGTIVGSLVVNVEPGILKYVLPDNIIAITGLKASSTYSTFINIPSGYTLALNPISLNFMDSISNIDVQSMTEKMSKMSMLQSFFDIQINFDFNYNSKELLLFEKPTSNTIVMEIAMEYTPGEIDLIYDNWWIQSRAVAEAKFTWGQVIGKYSSNLINGSSINFDRILSEASEELLRTEEELYMQFEPLGVFVS